MTRISVLVPYAPAGGPRERTWRWLADRWKRAVPDAEVITSGPGYNPPHPGLFCRACAINAAARQARPDSAIFVIADADTAFNAAQLYRAVSVAEEHETWVLPGRYVRLSQDMSQAWTGVGSLSDPPLTWEDGVEEEWPANVSGIVVVPREAFIAVDGFDERFTGWGCEDEAFACSLSALWPGACVRLGGHIAWHLWHPRPPEHSTGQPTYLEQRVLAARYFEARDDPVAMRALIAERHPVPTT